MIRRVVVLGAALLFVVLAMGAASAHYTPATGDRFSYDETYALTNGVGDYTGYTETTAINGSIGVTAVAPNGTASAYYYNYNQYSNNQGANEHWVASGPFSFSSHTFLYVHGTDNQTGYVNPDVWFWMDDSLAAGSTFYLLNTGMTVVSTSYDYDLNTPAGSYVTAIFAEGNGSFARNDVYGQLTATYNWKAYFDPTTGYAIGYVYTEQDSNASGSGFTITDTLGVTQTTYALSPGSAPAGSSSPSSTSWIWIAVALVVVVLVIIAIGIWASRRRTALPRHSATGRVTYAPPPMGPPPPGINLSPSGQPAVQQIVIKETVKVNCRYCGALIDTTAEKCPFCGAART
jgi:hypothetical protein